MIRMRVAIGNARIDRVFVYSAPFGSRVINPIASTTPRGLPARGPRSAHGPDTCGVMRLKDHVMQAFAEQRRHNSIVAGSVWQPQAFGLTAVSVTKIGQAAANLGPQIA